MVQQNELDNAMLNIQTSLNQLIALSDDAAKVLMFHKTLLLWELKTDNLKTAFSFSKSIIWKTLERDFYLYVYSQLSFWLRTTYDTSNEANILPKLKQMSRSLNNVLNICIGLELSETVPTYRKLLSECEGCENGLDTMIFDEKTIEQQALQLIEQTATEYGHNIRLYDRLNEISGAVGMEQLSIEPNLQSLSIRTEETQDDGNYERMTRFPAVSHEAPFSPRQMQSEQEPSIPPTSLPMSDARFQILTPASVVPRSLGGWRANQRQISPIYRLAGQVGPHTNYPRSSEPSRSRSPDIRTPTMPANQPAAPPVISRSEDDDVYSNLTLPYPGVAGGPTLTPWGAGAIARLRQSRDTTSEAHLFGRDRAPVAPTTDLPPIGNLQNREFGFKTNAPFFGQSAIEKGPRPKSLETIPASRMPSFPPSNPPSQPERGSPPVMPQQVPKLIPPVLTDSESEEIVSNINFQPQPEPERPSFLSDSNDSVSVSEITPREPLAEHASTSFTDLRIDDRDDVNTSLTRVKKSSKSFFGVRQIHIARSISPIVSAESNTTTIEIPDGIANRSSSSSDIMSRDQNNNLKKGVKVGKLFSPEASIDIPLVQPSSKKGFTSDSEDNVIYARSPSSQRRVVRPCRRLSTDSDTSDTMDGTHSISIVRGRPTVNPHSRNLKIIRDDHGMRPRSADRRLDSPRQIVSGRSSRNHSARNTPTLKVLMSRPTDEVRSVPRSLSSSSSSTSSYSEAIRTPVLREPRMCEPRSKIGVMRSTSQIKPCRHMTNPCCPGHHYHRECSPVGSAGMDGYCPPMNGNSNVMVTHVCLDCQRNLDLGKTLIRAQMSPPKRCHTPCYEEKTWKIQPIAEKPIYVQRQRSLSRRKSKPRRSSSKTYVITRSSSPRKTCQHVVDDNGCGNPNRFVGTGEIYANQAFLKVCHNRGFSNNGSPRYRM